ncbi:hypothetical protein [Gordonia sp. VNK21]|uniref:hypothetical protein n=1 Tax=Gordonia sp. VNK21 TaxID=3382483 RepID=UPI0038D37855
MSRGDRRWPDETPFDDGTRMPTTPARYSEEARLRAYADPQYRRWRSAVVVVARPAGIASAVAAVVCGLLTVTSIGDGLADGAAGQLRLSGWLAMGGAAVAGVLLAVDRRRRPGASAHRAVVFGIVTALAVLTLDLRSRAAAEHGMALSFLGQTSTLILSVLGLSAAALAWLCLTVAAAGPPQVSEDAVAAIAPRRAGAVAGIGAALVWALTIGLIAGIAPASPLGATTTAAPASEPAAVNGFDVAYRLHPDGRVGIRPIVGGFLLVDDRRVTAHDGATGSERWHLDLGETGLPEEGADLTGVRARGTEVVMTRNGYTVVLDAQSGRIRHRSTRVDGQFPDEQNGGGPGAVSRAFDYSYGECTAAVPLEVDGATVTADCTRPGRLQRTDEATGDVRTVDVAVDAGAVSSLTLLQDLGASLVAMTVWPPGDGALADGPLEDDEPTVQTIIVDVAAGREVDRFSTAQFGGTEPAVSRRADLIAVAEENRDSGDARMVIRNVRTHTESRIDLPESTSKFWSGTAWAGDTVVAGLLGARIARIDTARGNAVTVDPAPCPSFGSNTLDLRAVPGAILVQCTDPSEIVALH